MSLRSYCLYQLQRKSEEQVSHLPEENEEGRREQSRGLAYRDGSSPVQVLRGEDDVGRHPGARGRMQRGKSQMCLSLCSMSMSLPAIKEKTTPHKTS